MLVHLQKAKNMLETHKPKNAGDQTVVEAALTQQLVAHFPKLIEVSQEYDNLQKGFNNLGPTSPIIDILKEDDLNKIVKWVTKLLEQEANSPMSSEAVIRRMRLIHAQKSVS